jgi:tetratricopeptide (TPR) repeat protein
VEAISEPVSLEQSVTEVEFEQVVSEEIPSTVTELQAEPLEVAEPIQPEIQAEEPVSEAIETPAEEEAIPVVMAEEVQPEPEAAIPVQAEEPVLPPFEEFEPTVPEQPVSQIEEKVETTHETAPVEPPVVEEIVPEYDEVYNQALQSVDAGDLETAQEQFIRLIRAETHLDQVVEKLSSAVETYPTDSGLWMTLGDAFGRSGKLQNALDAYTRAEEYLQ